MEDNISLEELYLLLKGLFESIGDPVKMTNLSKYSKIFKDETLYIVDYYQYYKAGVLKEYLAFECDKIPKVYHIYLNDINALIKNIKEDPDLEASQVIVITTEINNSDELYKLKEEFPTKEIILIWNNEVAFIDSVIDALYMINYYESLIDDNLSTLEKITYAYDIVKSFIYTQNTNNEKDQSSRHITKITNSDYIVCVGYAEIFNRILNDLGIKSNTFSVKRIEDNKLTGHARNLIYVKDSKYNLDGYYVFDPTFDSLNQSYYHKFEKDKGYICDEKKEGFERGDTLSSYKYFLIPVEAYEAHFEGSFGEQIYGSNKTQDQYFLANLLHNNQTKKKKHAINAFAFMALIRNIRRLQGYDEDSYIRLVQEALVLSNYSYYNSFNVGIFLAINKDEEIKL